MKWRAYPPDVLPAFVAEMDFDLAEPIVAPATAAGGSRSAPAPISARRGSGSPG
jgi:hypothetical protein